MRISWNSLAVVASILPAIAYAQTSNEMTCEAAAAYFGEHRMIETTEGGQVLPIDQGVPVAQRDELVCEEGNVVEPTFVQTSDNPRCVIAYHCADD